MTPQVEKYAPKTIEEWLLENSELQASDYLYYIAQHIAMNLARLAVTHVLVLEKLEGIETIWDEATSEDNEGS